MIFYISVQFSSVAQRVWLYNLSKCVCSVIQSWPTLCDPTDCSQSGSSVHGIFQASWAFPGKNTSEVPFSTPGDLPDTGIEPASPVSSSIARWIASAGDIKRHGFNPQVGKIPWKRAWQPTPIFLPRESHEQRSLATRVTTSQTQLKWLSIIIILYHRATWEAYK